MPNGRCNLHGGKSLGGLASPTFKHGRYSKYLPDNLAGRYRQALEDPCLLELRDEIALLDARLGSLVEGLETGESRSTWAGLQAEYRRLEAARSEQNWEDMAAALTEVGRWIEHGAAEGETWDEIVCLLEQRRKLVASEHKHMIDKQQLIAIERVMIIIAAVVNVIGSHIHDRKLLNAIRTDLRRVLGTGDTIPVGGTGEFGRGGNGATVAAGVDSEGAIHQE